MALVVGVSGGNGASTVEHKFNQFHGVTDFLARELEVCRPTITINNACASSNAAIGIATDLVTEGYDVIAGGAEELLDLAIWGFGALDAMDTEKCSPFGTSRGMNLGEGAAFLMMQRVGVDAKRTMGLILGYGLTSDAFNIASPHPSGEAPARAMTIALQQARVQPEVVRHVNAHGTGTKANDRMEVKAIRMALRPTPDKPVVVSATKSQIGHTQGAAGAIEAVMTFCALEANKAPPIIGAHQSTMADIVFPKVQFRVQSIALSTNYAFGGLNAALLLSASPKRLRRVAKAPEIGREAIFLSAAGAAGKPGYSYHDWASVLNTGESMLERTGVGLGMRQPDAIESDSFPARDWRRLDGTTKLLLKSIESVATDRSVALTDFGGPNTGLVIITRAGAVDSVLEIQNRLRLGRNPNPALFPTITLSSHAGHLTRMLGITGPAITVMSGGVSMVPAIRVALAWLRTGKAERVIVAAADLLNELSLDGDAAPLVSLDVGRPFDPNSPGINLGSMGCAFLLEKAAPPESLQVIDLEHTSNPNEAARRSVLERVTGRGTRNNVVVAAATGNRGSDALEASALSNLIAQTSFDCNSLAIPSSIFGDCQSASGMLNLLTAVAALRGDYTVGDQVLVTPAAANVPIQSRPTRPSAAIACASSWSGAYGAVLIQGAAFHQ